MDCSAKCLQIIKKYSGDEVIVYKYIVIYLLPNLYDIEHCMKVFFLGGNIVIVLKGQK